MARVYLSDPVEMTWAQPEHETFALLAERIEDYLAAQPMAMNEPIDDGLLVDEPVWCDGCMGWCSEF